ncbi:MAG: aspartate ammonia-lyase [Acidobacteria bacterium 13_1_40CM_56_16]|nr:MAG: aspartate ammonia-lyase [Acidobacteria bacterium 13_1_40CM_56_16]OLD71644.1 MAG: aspartate ammonia-lyase [Acidobacteria bacterium 13_1_40CM_2_56_11]
MKSIAGGQRNKRIERDSMGEVAVPADAFYGAQTQRAVENFPISNLRFPREFIRAVGLVKLAAARANMDLGLLDKSIGNAIVSAARETADGKLDRHFVLDIFQTGSGTSTNMNANEVIRNRAMQMLGGNVGDKKPVHPNDHVNMGQSSNDVIPTAMHVAVLDSIEHRLIPALRKLQKALNLKAAEFDSVVKIGRTHLQDATPVRLGQEFGGYARQVRLGISRLEKLRETLGELPLGGTAVGTGINTHPKFAASAIRHLSKLTGLNLREAGDHFEAQSAKDSIVEASGTLKTIAVSLTKIASDIRLLASGPRCGIGEITLPETQPGSSIMPGKVNPVIAESVLMAAAQVIGNDLTITIGGQAGILELNVMMPVMAHNILESIRLLAASATNLSERCILGIQANKERCNELVEKSLAMCTALAPEIGYDAAASIAEEAYKTGQTVRQIATAKKILPAKRLREILDPLRMTKPGIAAKGD